MLSHSRQISVGKLTVILIRDTINGYLGESGLIKASQHRFGWGKCLINLKKNVDDAMDNVGKGN